jgi:hypothetical protein
MMELAPLAFGILLVVREVEVVFPPPPPVHPEVVNAPPVPFGQIGEVPGVRAESTIPTQLIPVRVITQGVL